ncbi:MAG: hypothetical protein KME10_12785 [Plectolyngbya sp. WJT66-NPBG17]|nr:hypothetical protein [Plectolyngbya sp. WJT66-NPBG17]
MNWKHRGSASGTDYATSSATIGLATGNFNTDGTADAITIDGTTSKATLTPGNGDGTLEIGLDDGFGIVSSPKPQAIYDGLNRLKTETNPLGKSRTWGYSFAANQTTMTDRNNPTRAFK